jgi:hypothetical protein
VDAGVDKELVAMLSATEDVAKEDVSTEYLMSKRANTLES